MTGAGIYVLPILAAPLVWAAGLAVVRIVQQRRERRAMGRPSVAEIVQRVEGERVKDSHTGRHWPGVELDRPTTELPKLPASALRPHDSKPQPYPRTIPASRPDAPHRLRKGDAMGH